MWKYIRPYLPYAVFAALCMVGEVSMDLLQPDIMSRLVDEGVLGISNGGVPDINMVLVTGAAMLGIALLGCLFGSTNNVFVQYAGQSVATSCAGTASKTSCGFRSRRSSGSAPAR